MQTLDVIVADDDPRELLSLLAEALAMARTAGIRAAVQPPEGAVQR